MKEFKCEVCGKLFSGYGNRRFCSKSCSSKITNLSEKRKKDRKRICECCGKEFEYKNSNKNQKYCSLSCINQKNRTQYCLNCNKELTNVQIRAKQTYCSTICANSSPDCNKKISTNENELNLFIQSLGFTTKKHQLKNKQEIDIFIPELNIGFEYNGCYWHCDKQKDKNYHYDKVTAAGEEGIRLIMIWEYEWINSNRQIKSYIKAQLGLCEHRIYARNCIVKECNYQEVKHLLQYHQQGTITATKYIGLYHKEELVLAMLFGKPRNTKNIEWEIYREVCKEGYSIVGGKSKVFNYFVKTYNPQSVLSFVDRSKFTGKSYQIMGFELEKICEARYDWVYKDSFIFKKRQPAIYKEMMALYIENKVFRVYDSGRYKYVYKNNER